MFVITEKIYWISSTGILKKTIWTCLQQNLIKNVFNFFLLYIIKNYKQDAFKIQEKIARCKSQKKKYDNLNFLLTNSNVHIFKILLLRWMKIVA